jgi:MtN3 and saliva related transmembrane protein
MFMNDKLTLIKLIGFLAGFLTTFSFLPQVVKSLRTRHMDDFNLLFIVLMLAGLVLWMVYGFMLGQLPLIVANGLTIALNLILLWLKLDDMVRQRAAKSKKLER